MKTRSKLFIISFTLTLAAGVAVFLGMSHNYTKTVNNPPNHVQLPTHQEKPTADATKQITIYRVAMEGDQAKLQPVKVSANPGTDKYKSALSMLIKESASAHTANPIPSGTKLLGIKVKNGLATINFSKEFRSNFNGGSEGEALTIDAILRTLGQFPEIKRVQLLLEGKPLDTLGHIDLSGPLDVDWAGSDLGGEN